MSYEIPKAASSESEPGADPNLGIAREPVRGLSRGRPGQAAEITSDPS